jgi:hypothetical protein
VSAALVARFIFTLGTAPAGTVELAIEGSTYTYRSVHVYRRTKAERVDKFPLSAKPVPEGLWLLKQPKVGCVDGVAEISHEKGQLCADAVKGNEVGGKVLGKDFTAKYDDSGDLMQVTMAGSTFVRTDKPLVPGHPYANGFPISGKGTQLTLDPPVEGTRWPEREPRGVRTKPAAEDECLKLAEEFVEGTDFEYVLALGLVVEKGRAWPHAWAHSPASGDVDPSAKKTDNANTPNRSYLAFPTDQAGALYVDLLDGKRKLVWK